MKPGTPLKPLVNLNNEEVHSLSKEMTHIIGQTFDKISNPFGRHLIELMIKHALSEIITEAHKHEI